MWPFKNKFKNFVAYFNNSTLICNLALSIIGVRRALVSTSPMNLHGLQCGYIYLIWGRRVIGISGSLICSKTLMELIFNPCGEFRLRPEGPISQNHCPHLHVDAPGIFSYFLRSVQMLLFPTFAVEDLPSAELQPWFLCLQ